MSTIERAIDKLSQTDQGFSTDPDEGEKKTADSSQMGAKVDTLQASGDELQEGKPQTNEGSQSRIELNFEKLKHMGIITPDADRSQLGEEMRHIKRHYC